MDKENMKPIKHIKIRKDEKISELVEDFKEIGFQARKIGEAGEIFLEIIKKRKQGCKIFFGMAGALVPGGMKEIIIDMLKSDCIDVFVTTGANLTHDLIEALGNKHYQGDEKADDYKLNKKGIDRIYNVFMENKVYQDLEKFFTDNWQEISKTKTIKELLWKIGSLIKSEESILRVCYEKNIPVFCPAIADSGIGLMVWGKKVAGQKIFIDAFEDMNEIIDISWKNKNKAVIYVGGGTPKNFIQQAMQFSTPAFYGIQITTDKEEFGGSSGAKLKEGISWGKMDEKGKFVDVRCDATIALPLVWGYCKDKI